MEGPEETQVYDAIVDAEATDEIEQAMAGEEEILAYTGQSDYDSAYAAIARRAMRRAEMLDDNPAIAKTVKRLLLGIERWCYMHNADVTFIDVRAKVSSSGEIVFKIFRHPLAALEHDMEEAAAGRASA